jgi:hypothetical protein
MRLGLVSTLDNRWPLPNKSLNSDVQKRRFALLLPAG